MKTVRRMIFGEVLGAVALTTVAFLVKFRPALVSSTSES